MKNVNQPKMHHSTFYKFLKFFLVLLLRLIAIKSKPYKPTLQDKVMGEKRPLSNQYFIPDDKH